MKRSRLQILGLFFAFIIVISSCTDNDNAIDVNNKIIGTWSLSSQRINGSETISSCTNQTNFVFESGGILRKNFYALNNGNCQYQGEDIFSWSINGTDIYRISNASGSSNLLQFTFSNNDSTFEITETDGNNNSIVSIFNKN